MSASLYTDGGVWAEVRDTADLGPGASDRTAVQGAMVELTLAGRLHPDNHATFELLLTEWPGTLDELLEAVAWSPVGSIPKGGAQPF